MSFFSKTEAYLGVDIGAHGIKLVELRKTKGRPQLWTYGILDQTLDIHLPEQKEKSPEDLLASKGMILSKKKEEDKGNLISLMQDERIDRYAGLLKALLKRAKTTTTNATASLPVSYIFHAVLTLPRVDDKEIDKIVKAEVAKMLSRPVDQMQVVHQKIPEIEVGKDKVLRILVTAAPRVLVEFYTLIFQKAGLQLQELETEAFAVERSLVGRDKAIAMVVDIGAERTNFFIIDQGLPLTHRTISAGGYAIDRILARELGIEPELVGKIKYDLSKIKEKISVEMFQPFLDSITKEIEYSFDLFFHQSGYENKKPEKIILAGGSCVFPFIKEGIQRNFPMRVFVGDPWARTVYQEGLRSILDGIGPRMAVCLGLAMRNII